MGRLFCERVAQLLWSNSFTTSMSVPLGSGPCMPWTERMLFECLCCYGNTVGRTEHRVIPSACSRSIPLFLVHDRRWPRWDRSIVLTLPVRGFFFAICRSFVQHACMIILSQDQEGASGSGPSFSVLSGPMYAVSRPI
jgi:hypothetical protein